MKFIDSNIIAYAFYHHEFQKNCQEMVRGGGITDTLVLIEAFNIIELQTSREMAVTAIKAILKSAIEIVDVDINVVFEALKKSQNYKQLKFLDLVHYTVAVMKNCDTILSSDKDFDHLEIPRKESWRFFKEG